MAQQSIKTITIIRQIEEELFWCSRAISVKNKKATIESRAKLNKLFTKLSEEISLL